MQKYEEMFPAFSDSRECKLVKVRFLLLNVLMLICLILKKIIEFVQIKTSNGKDCTKVTSKV